MRGAVYAPKKTIRDFNKKRYSNPLFPRGGSSEKKMPSGFWKSVVMMVLPVILFVAAVAYGIWGPLLGLEDISVVGATPNTEHRLRSIIDAQKNTKLLGVLPQSNTLLFRMSLLERGITDAFLFDSLVLRKKLPHGLTVEVKERDLRAAFIVDSTLYAVDQGCTLIRELTSDEVSGLPFLPTGVQAITISDQDLQPTASPETKTEGGDTIPIAPAPSVVSAIPKNIVPVLTLTGITGHQTPGKNVCSEAMLNLVREVDGKVFASADAAAQWYIPDDEAQSLEVVMDGGWHVFFSSALPLDSQLQRLTVVLKEKVGKNRDGLAYIDLRYNEKVFLRMK
jgi:cell division septal protein FtsQ